MFANKQIHLYYVLDSYRGGADFPVISNNALRVISGAEGVTFEVGCAYTLREWHLFGNSEQLKVMDKNERTTGAITSFIELHFASGAKTGFFDFFLLYCSFKYRGSQFYFRIFMRKDIS